MTYDEHARRDTPLARKLKAQIAKSGPMSVAEYMSACLHDPDHGYYTKQPAIGASGDFITAPEISQVFGELIVLWAAVVWQQMGAPPRINLVELGPGRGTLMRDALRAARHVPDFFEAVSVHLVESNSFLAGEQAKTLSEYAGRITSHKFPHEVLWHDEARDGAPTIVIANEFLDTFGVHQFVYSDAGWHPREVSVDSNARLQFATGPSVGHWPGQFPSGLIPVEGDVYEHSVSLDVFAKVNFAKCAEKVPFAALLIDYGHSETGFGDTLQAVSQHQAVSPLYAPGETDLTAQVDFQALCDACRRAEGAKLAVDGPTTQAEFLGRLGIVERASRLMTANPSRAGEIESGVARLIAPNGMGTRFKAIGLRSSTLPHLPGFGA